MKRWSAKTWVANTCMVIGLMAATLGVSGCGGIGYVGISARTAPPPIRVETFGSAPGPGYVWLKGYWGYRGGVYVWNSGRWERPPRGYRRWDDGRWERRGNGYRWREGRWR